jgi:hypothetical protein
LTILTGSDDLVDGEIMIVLYKQYLEGNESGSLHLWQWISLAEATKNINAA